MKGNVSLITKSRAPIVAAAARKGLSAAGALALAGLVAVVHSAWAARPLRAGGPRPAPVNSAALAETQDKKPEGSPAEIVVYASDLSKKALRQIFRQAENWWPLRGSWH